MANLPIKFHEVLQLQALGLKSFTFASCTLTSEKYVCVRDTVNNQPHVVIVDIANPTSAPTQFPVNAEAAIVHPKEKILALRAGQQMQIFHIDEKRKIKEHAMAEPVIYWTWISANSIAIVTDKAVYHWGLEGTSAPEKIFDRAAELSGTQIIGYKTDHTKKWLLLIGIAQREGRIVGAMQLYSIDKKVSQSIEGHAATFLKYQLQGQDTPSILFSFVNRTATSAKLYILEVGNDNSKFEKKAVEFFFPREAAGDFPVTMQASSKHGVLYMITKFGYLYLFDLGTGKTIFMNRITANTIFATTPTTTGGILSVNTSGQMLSVIVDEANIVPYVANVLNDINLAISIATANNLPGADDLVVRQFNQLLGSGDYAGAARIAATSPGGILRTSQTIQRFKQLPAVAGQHSPLLQYFGILLEKGALNNLESLELAQPVVQQQRTQLLDNWLAEDKLGCSEELGDFVRPHNIATALKIYFKAEVHHKVIACFAETGQYDKIVAYANKTNYTPEWGYLLQNIIAVNPQGAVGFAQSLLNATPPLIDPNVVVEAFMSRGLIKETTSMLLDILKENKPEQADLQTKLLEVNLLNGAANVADAIMGNNLVSHYDKPHIALLCEKNGLTQRALENFTNFEDIKRVLLNGIHNLQPEFIVEYVANLPEADALECVREILQAGRAQNIQLCVAIAGVLHTKVGAPPIINLFESFQAYEGIYFFLGSIIGVSEDPEVHFKYIEAATKINRVQDVERIVRESNFYEPERVKDFLKEAKLSDQVPLIIVCDRFDFVDDLTRFLYKNNLSKYIEVYIQQVNPAQTPVVVGSLIDIDCNEDYIRTLVKVVGNRCPVEELVAQVEKRNRLKLLLPYLEERIAEGNQEPATHNAIVKVYIDMNRDPQTLLLSNPYYDSKVVGKYCENRDPHLSFIAYKRGAPDCDDELIEVTNKNGLFRNQARYVVERRDEALWAKVLDTENEYRNNIIDQVIQTAVPESQDHEEVKVVVKAFMSANLPEKLIELLEKLVLEQKGFFSGNKHLQNLLLLTAIRAAPTRVIDFINKLDNFDSIDIANIALDSKLYDEAFSIYKKFDHHELALGVLVNDLDTIERAYDFAERVNSPKVYSILGKAQLDRNMVTEAIASFIKADNHEFYIEVIEAAKRTDCFDDLVKFLTMCRKKFKEARIETELCYAYAKTGALRDMDDLISGPNSANILDVGDRCFNEGMYEAARLLFNNICNYSRLATTVVRLQDFSGAVDAARKANSTRTWREVAEACIDAKEFRYAQICGLNIIIHTDELDDLINYYESRGHYEELLALLEHGLNMERAHVGMFTELAILYSKFKPQKLMEHIQLFYNRMNIPKVLRACEAHQQWPELTFLYIHYDEYDNAALAMIDHPTDAWEHALFKEIIVKVANLEIFYKAIEFYLEASPMKLVDLLMALIPRIDHARVVKLVRNLGHLAVIKPYLVKVQEANIKSVNLALNELFVDEEDYVSLRQSIDQYANFDSLELAQRLEQHELIEFRRIAAYLYKQNGKDKESLLLSQKDNLWQDAIKTAAESKRPELCQELLRSFVEQGRKDCFAACLYTCFDFVEPDVALELAWKHDMMDFAMPYFIQIMKEYTGKVDKLHSTVFPKVDSSQPDSFQAPQQMDGFFAPGVVQQPPQRMMTGQVPPPQMMTGQMPPQRMMTGQMPPPQMMTGQMPMQQPQMMAAQMPIQSPTASLGSNMSVGQSPTSSMGSATGSFNTAGFI